MQRLLNAIRENRVRFSEPTFPSWASMVKNYVAECDLDSITMWSSHVGDRGHLLHVIYFKDARGTPHVALYTLVKGSHREPLFLSAKPTAREYTPSKSYLFIFRGNDHQLITSERSVGQIQFVGQDETGRDVYAEELGRKKPFSQSERKKAGALLRALHKTVQQEGDYVVFPLPTRRGFENEAARTMELVSDDEMKKMHKVVPQWPEEKSGLVPSEADLMRFQQTAKEARQHVANFLRTVEHRTH